MAPRVNVERPITADERIRQLVQIRDVLLKRIDSPLATGLAGISREIREINDALLAITNASGAKERQSVVDEITKKREQKHGQSASGDTPRTRRRARPVGGA